MKSSWGLSIKMKFMITVFACLVLWSVMLVSFSDLFTHQLLSAIGNVDSKEAKDKLLRWILTADFDEDSCLSRHQSSLYRKPSPHKPSEYLISKLRSYEILHRRCGPGTRAYKEATKNLIGHDDENYANRSVGECRYIVWVAAFGLGNRILTLASVFLHALLTGRVVLVDQSKDISDLFCEPFPVFACLVLWSVMLVSFSDLFTHQLLSAIGNVDSKEAKDKLLRWILTADFDEDSCLSRHQSSLYRKPSPHKPSEYLISKLRSYEILHRRCGPGTRAYKEATKNLIGHDDENYANISVGECRYIVWVAAFGLGNRILTLASVFLHALLTGRVVLVDQSKDMSDLFCEPFPGTSWLLPHDFPLMGQIGRYNMGYSRCYGTMLRNHAINSTSVPPHLYLHILHDSRDVDKMFFCPMDQTLIDKVPWLIVKANVYFVPSLWFNPNFHTELIKLFPQKETVFYHLAGYLFHPTNQVWGMVTRSYDAYLSRADQTLGIQVRVFTRRAGYVQHVMDQIVACTQREKLLPELATPVINASRSKKLNAVLVTSLNPEYSNNLKNMYWERPTSTGDLVQVYQPSGERFQQTDKKLHDQKALAEIYLLSLTDNIVTSAGSTFGYVAHSLGGLKPWLLYRPFKGRVPDPPCVLAVSMEPCYITSPSHGCENKKRIDLATVFPFVRHCEDTRHDGVKLFDDTKDEL
uniref:Fucosyltransferase n=1 Tax=Brassica campestris TaxID=3711 RepID=M4EDK1_BRACM